MAFVVIAGYIVEVSPPVKKLVVALAAIPKMPKSAVAYIAFMVMTAPVIKLGL